MAERKTDQKVGALNAPADPPAPSGVAAAMGVAVVLGAVLGAAISAVLLPDLIVASALGGAMFFGAIRAIIIMSSDRRGLAPLDNEDGTGQ